MNCIECARLNNGYDCRDLLVNPILHYRKKAKKTVWDLSIDTGISTDRIENFEKQGVDQGTLDVEEMVKLANALDTCADDLIKTPVTYREVHGKCPEPKKSTMLMFGDSIKIKKE